MATIKTIIANIKGPKGDPGEQGPQGIPGTEGVNTKWYTGTGITGIETTETIFSESGVTLANPDDYYLNTKIGNVYRCVTGGDVNTATWVYVCNLNAALSTDKTLTIEDKAADAKAVGEEILKLDEIITNRLTIVKGTLLAGETSVTIEDERITEDSILSFYASIYGASLSEVTVTTGSVTLVYTIPQEADMEVGVRIDG